MYQDSTAASRPSPPPRGYSSWQAFEAEVVDSMASARRELGEPHEAVVVVLAHAAAGGRPCPALTAAVKARCAEPDGARFRAQLDEVAEQHKAWSSP